MCEDCWAQDGYPQDMPSIRAPEAIAAIQELWAQNGCAAGGPLWEPLGNYQLEFLTGQRWYAEHPSWPNYPAYVQRLCHRIMGLMAPMALPERAAVLAAASGWEKPAQVVRHLATARCLRVVAYDADGNIKGPGTTVPGPALISWSPEEEQKSLSDGKKKNRRNHK